MLNKPMIMSSEDSWEVRAFEEDLTAGNLLGCTWPPRNYKCTFCRRDFRSAQALGGHMNVHRRERARIQQETTTLSPPPPPLPVKPSSGLCCIIYALPSNPNTCQSTKTEPEEVDLELRLGQRPPPPPP
ncbi:hypothetical protein CASFOL_010768 [Castilleja foliolosa]|uniref:C2H2-type domain-containing protein n=1 Tax=Castilleja foliolosa TaxID=1961234 RepID=A0ABD3DU16_9LAMI